MKSNIYDRLGYLFFGLCLVVLVVTIIYVSTKELTPNTIVTSEVTRTIYQDREVIKTVYTDRFITEIRHFQSKEQFYSWYLSVKTEMFAASKPSWLCADYAWWMVEKATNDGYLLSYCQIWNDAYNSIFKWNKFAGLDGSHAVVSTPIKGFTCMLEPQNGEIYPPIK